MKLVSSKARRGFTLIELLVVIAIIGILSAVVLASLNTARNKGSDAAIKSSLNSSRAQSELFYDANGNNYVGTADICASGAVANGVKGVDQFLLNAQQNSNAVSINRTYSTTGASSTVTCHATGSTGWGIEAPLKNQAGYFYCVDSSGKATTTSGSTLAASDYLCG